MINKIPIITEEFEQSLDVKEFSNRYSHVPLLPATKLYGQKTKLYDRISSGCVRQGRLGDCFLISSLAALTEMPHLIKRLFNFADSYDDDGYYYVRLYAVGMPVVIAVTTSIPVIPDLNIPLFCQANYNETWAFLAEKAYSILVGGYNNLMGGCTAEALNTLTGYPVDVKKGFINNHAYTIVSVKDSPPRIIVRNPWGCGISPDDVLNFEELESNGIELPEVNELMELSLDEFMSEFIEISILKYDNRWQGYHYRTLSYTTKYLVFDVEIDTECDVVFGFHQESKDQEKLQALRGCIVDESCLVPYGGTAEYYMKMFYVSTKPCHLPIGKFKLIIEREEMAQKIDIGVSLWSSLRTPLFFQKEENPNDSYEFILPSFEKKYGRCSICDGVLSDTSIDLDVVKIHTKCLRCSRCEKMMSIEEGIQLDAENKIVCDECARSEE
ncbi:Calpain [Entamoeba marina]